MAIEHGKPETLRDEQQKEPYSSPQFIEYGDVRKFTQTGGLSVGDAGPLKRPKA
jgi:hypothetical protein